MTTTCLSQFQGMADDEVLLSEYEPNIGAPFRVILVHSVRQKISPQGEVVSTCIPNMGGLLKEIALTRSLHDRKFSSAELKFVRKAIGLRANELAGLLGVSAEHLSRCENSDRVLSASAEKLLRVIVLKRRYKYAPTTQALQDFLIDGKIDASRESALKRAFSAYVEFIANIEKSVFALKLEAAYDASDELSFEFMLRNHDANDSHSQDDEEWKSALAA